MADALKAVYNRAYIVRLGDAIARQHPVFPSKHFVRQVLEGDWDELELKARMRKIRSCLHHCMDLPYKTALDVLMAAAPEFGGYHAIFFADFVEAYGLEQWSASMRALAHFTQYSTAEFAVRPFILQDPPRMLEQLSKWSRNKNEHLRRLASEGSRPRLPWALALPLFKRDPTPLLPILEQLRADPSLYVRRSVANNLNDIAKDNPEFTLDIAKRWQGQHRDTDWIIKHACRSLLKRAHPRALSLFSYEQAPHVTVKSLNLGLKSLRIGEHLEFELCLAGTPSLGRLRLEYGIDYVKASGKLSRKVFKIAEGDFPDAERQFRKRHSLAQMTTRKHYPGRHGLAIIVNGVVVKEGVFNLVEAAV